MEKIIRTICLFTDKISDESLGLLDKVSDKLQQHGFIIQTKRICLSDYDAKIDDKKMADSGILLGMGSVSFEELKDNLENFLASSNKSLNLDLTGEDIDMDHVEILFRIIKAAPVNTFNFTYGFNIPASTPYFPSAKFGQSGFSVGLQPTNLAANCKTLEEWFINMKQVWQEIDSLLEPIEGYLGIDSSIAPLFEGDASLINFIKKLGYDFNRSVTTDIYTRITRFIKEDNPRPVGLCGLMFPCLEDFELASEYEQGRFSIERNIFLSLHSGVGIDTYPIGIDQDKNKIMEILKLLQQLSDKYNKPFSARFVSDGQSTIGEVTDFKNKYLKDVKVGEL